MEIITTDKIASKGRGSNLSGRSVLSRGVIRIYFHAIELTFLCFGSDGLFISFSVKVAVIMESVLNSRRIGLGSNRGDGLCIVFLVKAFYSLNHECLSPPRCINGYWRIYCWG